MVYLIGIAGVIVAVAVLLWLNAVRGTGAVLNQLDEKIQPAIAAVQGNSESAGQIINDLAEIPETRNHLYNWLKDNNRESLFPNQFRELEKVAESDLAQWLMHPNELKEAPAEIEFVRKVPVQKDDKNGAYYLFKFRVREGHWASQNGWMAGAAGPYWDGEEIPFKACGTFSELVSFNTSDESQHIDLLRKLAKRWGVVVPT